MPRDPRFSGARRHGNTYSNPPLKYKPGRESLDQVPTTVIDDMKIATIDSCGPLTVIQPPQRIVRPATQYLSDNFGGAEGAENNEQ
jgi:hypothetical protein